MFLGIVHTYPGIPDPNRNVEPGNGPGTRGVCGPKKMYTGKLCEICVQDQVLTDDEGKL